MRQLSHLLVRFPKLGMVWSTAYLETVELFIELKKNQLEPEIHRFSPDADNEPDDGL